MKFHRDLEEKRSYLHDNEGNLKKGQNENTLKSEIIRLSTR